MIIIELNGGLGNQLFQYACARHIATKLNTDLKIDPYGLARANETGNIYRPFSLQQFKIAASIATPDEVKRLKYPFGICSKAWRFVSRRILRNFIVHWNPNVLKAHDNTYLSGYFQSERYFEDISDTVRKELQLAHPLSPEASVFADMIEHDERPPISLHVRRGDYVTHPDFGGIADEAYYARAIAMIRSKVPDAHFYIFSDDIPWCKENIDIADAVFVSSTLPDYETLHLMSRCNHHIIANSTFSWWGAWCNARTDKIVIAPTRWSNMHEAWYHDIIPSQWIRV